MAELKQYKIIRFEGEIRHEIEVKAERMQVAGGETLLYIRHPIGGGVASVPHSAGCIIVEVENECKCEGDCECADG